MDNQSLALSPRLDFAEAPRLLAALRCALAETPAIRIHGSAVEIIALPCLQVLLAAAKSHPGLIIENPAPALLAAFSDLRLEWPFAAPVESEEVSQIAAVPEAEAPGIAPEMNNEPEPPPIVLDEEPMLAPNPGKMVLTIDDSRTIRDLLMLTLTEAGYEVLQGVDGQNGLDVLGDQHVDLIITDINMPIMDGYEVIRRLRAKPAYGATPILVLTTESDKEKRVIAREAGATGWLVKPFDPDRLIETVRKVMP